MAGVSLALLWPLTPEFTTVKHFVVVDDGKGDIPDDPRIIDYEDLLARSTPAGEFRVNESTAGNQNQSAVAMTAAGDYLAAWAGAGTGDGQGVWVRAFRPADALPSVAGALYVAETHHNLSGPIAVYWQRNGGVPVFGYPLSEAFVETNPSDGKQYLVQYFERNRLEYHPEYRGSESEILLGLLGVQSYTARYGPPVLHP